MMNGILLIDKPAGWTSHDVVAKIRSNLRDKLKVEGRKLKVGHSGTLDPFATGLLIILVGDYTKRADEFLKLDKTYKVTMKLGETSTTGDPEGIKTVVSSRKPGVSEIEKAIKGFVGEIEQTPPAFSAIKVNGQRAYKLARAGKPVNLKPRRVIIHSNILRNVRMPEVDFEVKVSSGTYIRSLVEDIGKALGTGAYTLDLRRTKIDKFNVEDAINPQNMAFEQISKGLISEL